MRLFQNRVHGDLSDVDPSYRQILYEIPIRMHFR